MRQFRVRVEYDDQTKDFDKAFTDEDEAYRIFDEAVAEKDCKCALINFTDTSGGMAYNGGTLQEYARGFGGDCNEQSC